MTGLLDRRFYALISPHRVPRHTPLRHVRQRRWKTHAGGAARARGALVAPRRGVRAVAEPRAVHCAVGTRARSAAADDVALGCTAAARLVAALCALVSVVRAVVSAHCWDNADGHVDRVPLSRPDVCHPRLLRVHQSYAAANVPLCVVRAARQGDGMGLSGQKGRRRQRRRAPISAPRGHAAQARRRRCGNVVDGVVSSALARRARLCRL